MPPLFAAMSRQVGTFVEHSFRWLILSQRLLKSSSRQLCILRIIQILRRGLIQRNNCRRLGADLRLIQNVTETVILRQDSWWMRDARVLRMDTRKHGELLILLTVLLSTWRLAPMLACCQNSETVLVAEIALCVQTVFEDLFGDRLPRARPRPCLNNRGCMLWANSSMVVVVVNTKTIQRIERFLLRLLLLFLLAHLDKLDV